MTEGKSEEKKECTETGETKQAEFVDTCKDSKEIMQLKQKIKKAFGLFDKENRGAIIEDDVGTIMRYLGQFPSKNDLLEKVLPELHEEETNAFIYYNKLERKLIEYYKNDEFAPDGEEVLLSAFQVLDETKTGFIDTDYLKAVLCEMGSKFSSKEFESFIKTASEPESDKICYEDFVSDSLDQISSALKDNE